MTITEYKTQVARQRREDDPIGTARRARKSKLKMRFAGRIDEEIARTCEKLDLLAELRGELNDVGQ